MLMHTCHASITVVDLHILGDWFEENCFTKTVLFKILEHYQTSKVTILNEKCKTR